jgi:hypothetical protein
MKKRPVPRFQFYFFSPKPRFYFCELLWFWKWRRFLNFYYPMKTISSRKSEVKSQVGHSQIRNELIETSPTSHRDLFFGVANSEVQLRAQSSLSGSAARLSQQKEDLTGREGRAAPLPEKNGGWRRAGRPSPSSAILTGAGPPRQHRASGHF